MPSDRPREFEMGYASGLEGTGLLTQTALSNRERESLGGTKDRQPGRLKVRRSSAALAENSRCRKLLADLRIASGYLAKPQARVSCKPLGRPIPQTEKAPLLLQRGLQWTKSENVANRSLIPRSDLRTSRAVVVGIGPIGGQVASLLETNGIEVILVDLSPINLHEFAQAGFSIVVGDGRDRDILVNAGVCDCELAVVCVPKDAVAAEIVKSLRQANKNLLIVVRCRFQSIAPKLHRAGATVVVSEEHEAAGPLMQQCQMLIGRGGGT